MTSRLPGAGTGAPRSAPSFRGRHVAAARPLLAIGLAGAIVLASAMPAAAQPPAGEPVHTVSEVVVYGGTPSGVVAAVAAARAGMTVSLIEPTGRIGGMMSSGLSWTDRGDVGVIGGIAREVFDGIQEREGSAYGRYAFSPSTAEAVFESLLSEAGVNVARGTRLAESPDAVTMVGNRIVQVRMESGDTFAADAFIDAGYEADLMARAGVPYRIGRESTAEYGESLAGVRPTRTVMNVPPTIDPGFPLSPPGPLGSGDGRIQASNYRVCLSTLTSNAVPFAAPEGYDPSRYDIFAEYMQQRVNQGQTPSKFWVLHVDRLVDGKWDLNHTTPLTFGMPGHNYGWPDGTYAEREAIEAEQRAYQQGFLYFLANDERVPAAIRTDMQTHGLCADEFTQTDHWPHRMYVREGRRMLGRTIVAQHDLKALISKPDTIGLASYPLDSHAVSRWMSSGRLFIEGHLEAPRIQRWSIPYGSITPPQAEASNLLVSVAASATHVAFASLRVEPQFMIMGHAAGTAAALAIERNLPVQQVPISALQARLSAQGAVLTDPGDIANSGFYTEIAWAYHQGITAGCGAIGHFCPSQQLPRDQMASLLARTLDLPSTSVDHFTDDETNAHEGNINRVAQAGITKGCAPDRYCPSGLVTRQEMASFLVRALDLPNTSVDSFTDDEGSIHENDINRLAASGITAGCSATRFCPTDRVTRGQILAFLYRAYDGGSVSGLTLADGDANRDGERTTEPDDEEPSETASPSPTPDPDDVASPTPSESPLPTDESASPAPSPTSDPTPAPPTPTPAPTPMPTPAPTPDPSGPP